MTDAATDRDIMRFQRGVRRKASASLPGASVGTILNGSDSAAYMRVRRTD